MAVGIMAVGIAIVALLVAVGGWSAGVYAILWLNHQYTLRYGGKK